MITAKNLIRHEFVGLQIHIKDSTNKEIIGLKGEVIDESRNTLSIQTEKKEVKVIKDQCVFIFTLPNKENVQVDGKLLVARPEDRIKKKHKKW